MPRFPSQEPEEFLYLQTLSAEDEVLVTPAAKGDNEAPRKKASRETRHQVWRHYIILVPNGLTLSPRPSARRKNGADLAGNSMPSDDMPVAKMESLALLNARVVKFVEHEDDGDVLVADKDFQDLLKNHQIACHEAVVSEACQMTWAQLGAGSFAVGITEQGEALAWSKRRIRKIKTKPELMIKLKCRWPEKFNKTTVADAGHEGRGHLQPRPAPPDLERN